jgi:hypothetical protein
MHLGRLHHFGIVNRVVRELTVRMLLASGHKHRIVEPPFGMAGHLVEQLGMVGPSLTGFDPQPPWANRYRMFYFAFVP